MNLKTTLFIFSLLFFSQIQFLNAQSKKEQIENLILQKDSLTRVIELEREKASMQKVKQDQLNSTLNSVIKQHESYEVQSKRLIEEMDKKIIALEERIKSFSDSSAYLKSELSKYQELELNHFIGEWCGEDKSIGGSISIKGSLFEGYSASYTTYGPFYEFYRVERINQNKITLYLSAIDGTPSFYESMGGQKYFDYLEKCKNKKFAEVEFISKNELSVNTNFPCNFLPNGWKKSQLTSGIYSIKKDINHNCGK